MAIGSSMRPRKRNFDCVQSRNTERNSLCLNSVDPYEAYGNQDSKLIADRRPQSKCLQISTIFKKSQFSEKVSTSMVHRDLIHDPRPLVHRIKTNFLYQKKTDIWTVFQVPQEEGKYVSILVVETKVAVSTSS